MTLAVLSLIATGMQPNRRPWAISRSQNEKMTKHETLVRCTDVSISSHGTLNFWRNVLP